MLWLKYARFTGDGSSADNPSTSNPLAASNPPAASSPPAASYLPAATSPQSHTAAIAGGVVGGIVGLALMSIVVGILYRMRRRRLEGENRTRAEPYLFDGQTALEKIGGRGINVAARLLELQLELDMLQRQRPWRTSHRGPGSETTEMLSSRGPDHTEDITNRLDNLRNEMARLGGQQQVIINELHPPPGYSG